MTPRRDKPANNSGLIPVVLLIAFALWSIFLARTYQKKGFAEGSMKMKVEMEEIMEEEGSRYRTLAESRFSDGMTYGQAVAERDCKNQLSIGNAICKMDLEKSYKQGAMDAIHHVALKCGKKAK